MVHSMSIVVQEELIGTVDIKTKNAHFYVQRNSEFGPGTAAVPFDVATVDEGNNFDLTSGIFTAPVSGLYHFQFVGVKSTTANHLDIILLLNGARVCVAFTSQPTAGTFESISLSASLRLVTGDKVNLYNWGTGVLADNSDHLTQFSGWLVEEDLM